jgi:ammonium transporter
LSRINSSPRLVLLALTVLLGVPIPCLSQEKAAALAITPEQYVTTVNQAQAAAKEAHEALQKGDSAWMMAAAGLVMLMVPGLALFYGGMVRRKNILATMMQSMVALAVVGVYWIVVGYSLAFGTPWLTTGQGSLLGWNSDLVLLSGIRHDAILPGTNIPVYLHMLFQGMFAIITPALISGAVAERIRFKPYCLFLILWVTVVYCPLAHMVWAMDWWQAVSSKGAGQTPVGLLGAMGALDFAGGTVVHIAAGFSSLAAIVILRKRLGYPEHSFHPNSMVLTLTGAGLLWFGWFGFNGGSALASGANAVSAFAATQAAAAAAGLSWMIAEWLHRGKPTALGLASGIVAGLVAVTPASGFVFVWGGLFIGLIAGVVCYAAVCFKPRLGYDDTLDAFGVHGIGGFLGALLTGVFCSAAINPDSSKDGLLAGAPGQVLTQLIAAAVSAALALVGSFILVKIVDLLLGFTAGDREETEGLDRTEHGEVGFDLGLATEAAHVGPAVAPRAAVVPPNGEKRFSVVIEGLPGDDLIHVWSDLCQPRPEPPSREFRAVYPFVTTVQGNRFRFRGGDPNTMRESLLKLFQDRTPGSIRAHVDQ